MPDALVVSDPSTILLQKNLATLYRGTPSKKGKVILFAQKLIFWVKMCIRDFTVSLSGMLFLFFYSELMYDFFICRLFQKKIYPERTLSGSQITNYIFCPFLSSLVNYGEFLRLVLTEKTGYDLFSLGFTVNIIIVQNNQFHILVEIRSQNFSIARFQT
jgi:hypothetical protein